MSHGLTTATFQEGEKILTDARCECGYRSGWFDDADDAVTVWERHLRKAGLTVAAITAARGYTDARKP